jgi:hypothetical protein
MPLVFSQLKTICGETSLLWLTAGLIAAECGWILIALVRSHWAIRRSLK